MIDTVIIAVIILGLGYFAFKQVSGSDPLSLAQPEAPDNAIAALASAIAKQENSNPIYNNPGDITDAWGFSTKGTFGQGILIFDTSDDGWSALYAKLQNIENGQSQTYPLSMTLNDFGLTWSGNDPNWGPNVARFLGNNVSVTDDMATVFSKIGG